MEAAGFSESLVTRSQSRKLQFKSSPPGKPHTGNGCSEFAIGTFVPLQFLLFAEHCIKTKALRYLANHAALKTSME
jgi:hypothetical protein